MKERSGPRGAQSHLTERENIPRATGARTSLKKKPAPRHRRENLLKKELALMQIKLPQGYSFTAKINF